MPQVINNNIIAKNTIFLSIRMVLVLGISLYTSRVVLAILGINDFGVYNVVCGFVTMFSFLNTSMNNAIQRFYNFELAINGEKGANNVYNVSLIIQLFVVVVSIIFTEIVGLWYLYEKMVIPADRLNAAFWVFQCSVVSLFFLIIQIPYSAAILAHEKMDYYAIVSIIDGLLKLGIVLVIPYIHFDKLVLYGILMVIINIADFLLYLFYSKAKFKELYLIKKLDKGLLKGMLSFSGWNMFGSFSGIMKEQGLNLILNLFFGPVVNAARGIAYQITGALQGFMANVTMASRPQLTQSYAQGDIIRTFKIMYSTSKVSYLVLFVLTLPVIFEIDYILKIWLGDNIPDYTSIFCIWVLLTSLMNVFNPPTSFIVHATGKMKRYQLITSMFNLALLPIAYFFMYMGANPQMVFILSFIFTIINQIISLYILKSIVSFSIKDYIFSIIFPLLIVSILSIIPVAVVNLNLHSGLLKLCLTIVVSTLSIIIFGYLIGLNRSERIVIDSFIKKGIRELHK